MRLHMRIATLALAALLAGTAGCASDPPQRGADNGKKATARLDIGADHLKQGRPALALREFMAAEQLNPGDPRIHYALGEAYLAQGKMADSELHYRQAVEIDPKYHDAWLSLSCSPSRCSAPRTPWQTCRPARPASPTSGPRRCP